MTAKAFRRGFSSPLFKTEALKWIQAVKTALIHAAAFKLEFVFGVISPFFLFFFIKYSLYSSIYSAPEGGALLRFYSFHEMTAYHTWLLIFEIFTRAGFFSENLSRDIRLGRISSLLLYPFGFLKHYSALFLADKALRFFISFFTLALALSFGFLGFPSLKFAAAGFLFMLAAAAFFFLIQIIIGMLAFWVDETWSLNVALRWIIMFASGSLLPLDFFPPALQTALSWTPFPYLAYFPALIFMGKAERLGFALWILIFWLAALSWIARLVFQKGLKLYTGSGI